MGFWADLALLSMKEAGVEGDIEENGTTFSENSMIKARGVYELIKNADAKAAQETIVLADDSGLEVDYLNKEPGIYSARYMGRTTILSKD